MNTSTQQSISRQKSLWGHIRLLVYWLLPIIILYFIFQRIDLDILLSNINKTNFIIVIVGLTLYPAIILVGAIRWYYLLKQYIKVNVTLFFAIKHYWVGLTLGFFTPASLGWDSYRVAVSGYQSRKYIMSTAIIFAEKLMALATCMSLIILLYFFVPDTASEEMDFILQWAYFLFAGAVIVFLVIFISHRNQVASHFIDKLENYCLGVLEKVGSRFEFASKNINRISIREMIEPLAIPKHLLPTIFLSFGIQVVSALVAQIFFHASGYDIPFIINLFITPILFFVFILPISFGSLGIREGAFILLYGLFGVPPETALLMDNFLLFPRLGNISGFHL